MKIAAIICNVVLLGFTCFVTLTDGAPKEASYIVFGLLLVLIPILNVVVISRSGIIGTAMRTATIICNIALLGFACWAIISQYPHPEEGGVLEFELLVILTPILSVAAILRKRTRLRWSGHHEKGKALEEQGRIDDLAEKQDA